MKIWKGTFAPVHPSGILETSIVAVADMSPQDIPSYAEYTDSDQEQFADVEPEYFLRVVYASGKPYYYPITLEEKNRYENATDNKTTGNKRAAGEEIAELLLGMIT